MRWVAWNYRRDGEDEEDLYSIAMLRVVKNRPKWVEGRGRSFKSFCTMVAIQAIAASRVKKRISTVSFEQGERTLDFGRDEPQYDDTLDSRAQLLTGEEKKLLRLRFVDGLTYRELGEMEGITRQAIQHRLENIYAILRLERPSNVESKNDCIFSRKL